MKPGNGTAKVPGRKIFADLTRRITEQHTEWNSPHRFLSLHWDGERASVGTDALVSTSIPPDLYPGVMAELSQKALASEGGDRVYAYALQIEGWAAIAPGEDASEAERRRFESDCADRTLHRRPDATEILITWCADVHGRVWSAVKWRNRPEQIVENFWTPGQPVDGQMVMALVAIACATGARLYGLPVGGGT